jgi:DNA-binding HxlR family transcriptional regulator
MPMSLREELGKKIRNGEFHCEKELTMSIISGKYKVVILWHLGHEGALRYGEIHRLFKDISDRILTKQLRELEQDCIVSRVVFPDSRLKVEYRLTETGLSLLPIVDSIYGWGRDHLAFYQQKASADGAQLALSGSDKGDPLEPRRPLPLR